MRVEPRHVDIGAGRFPDGRGPDFAQAGHAALQFVTADAMDRRAAIGEEGQEGVEFSGVAFPPDIQRAARAQESVLPQVRTRGDRQRDDLGTAVAFFPEGRRPPRRMVTGLVFRLKHKHARTGLC